MPHRGGEPMGKQHRHRAEKKGRAHADDDEREHIQVAGHEGAPAALQQQPARPPDHGDGERELAPSGDLAIDPGLSAQRRDQVRHRQQKHRQRERGPDPETPRHVAQFGVLAVVRACGDRGGFERHAALGAVAGMVLLHLWVHRARVDCMTLEGGTRARTRRLRLNTRFEEAAATRYFRGACLGRGGRFVHIRVGASVAIRIDHHV